MAARMLRLARAFVARSPDRRLERLLGSRVGQRAFFRAMQRAYVPGSLDGFTGDIVWSIGDSAWTLHVAHGRATAAPGAAERPALAVKVGPADLARIAVGELDPMRALLAGRLDVEGDFGVAARLGELFGRRPRTR